VKGSLSGFFPCGLCTNPPTSKEAGSTIKRADKLTQSPKTWLQTQPGSRFFAWKFPTDFQPYWLLHDNPQYVYIYMFIYNIIYISYIYITHIYIYLFNIYIVYHI
jgi:hypothetical protein